ncbi:MAG: type II toxin-antitoxin system RelE/ParE family toxin [Bacteroidaceae bacterium]|nr:type II toxin-antitoxin system RelE/ParE family toxin [Bacteroidaceae bacterium]
MDIKFEKNYLKELFYDGVTSDKHHRFQPDIVKRYVRVINILDSVDKTLDLFRYRSLHYEKLVGDKEGLESVRVNNQYRIEFRTSEKEGITICNIEELSNHYK